MQGISAMARLARPSALLGPSGRHGQFCRQNSRKVCDDASRAEAEPVGARRPRCRWLPRRTQRGWAMPAMPCAAGPPGPPRPARPLGLVSVLPAFQERLSTADTNFFILVAFLSLVAHRARQRRPVGHRAELRGGPGPCLGGAVRAGLGWLREKDSSRTRLISAAK